MIAATAPPVRNKFVSSGRRKQKIPEPVIVSEEEEEEGDEDVEDESVTRCVCGESHSIGLMVCCDQCEVWQHCECMGLDEDEIPEQYYCEQCKPSDHVEIKGYDNKTRRYYKPSTTNHASPVATDKVPRKRTTMNSREASISLEEVLALRNAIEQSKNYDEPSKSNNIKVNQSKESPTVTDRNDADQPQVVKQARSKRNGNSKKSDDQQKPQQKNNTNNNNNSKEKKPRQRSNNTPRVNTSNSNNSTPRRSTPAHSNHKSRSRTSTPQPSDLQVPTSCANQLFDHFSPSARASSPPAKVRYPSHRMSIQEMTRRANQILEYICSMQVEMAIGKRSHRLMNDNDDANEDDDVDEFSHQQKRRQLLDARISEAMTKAALELDREEEERKSVMTNGTTPKRRRPTPILIPGHDNNDTSSSPSSSLSSASTIPLDEDDRLLLTSKAGPGDKEKGVAEEALERIRQNQTTTTATTTTTTTTDKNEQTSMEIMDLLTKEVIIFQRRFGSFSYNNGNTNGHLPDDEESDGPVTRSSSQHNRYLMDRW
ncbi:MAG: hypothetical protein EXX96DRAFT_569201 [Benjaminiella poitrasii]|nr:MAG: hypothetical protein EXX96DRAFT_569201 [Benjaminiella poitrasii]